jgi:hypothetical protein
MGQIDCEDDEVRSKNFASQAATASLFALNMFANCEAEWWLLEPVTDGRGFIYRFNERVRVL